MNIIFRATVGHISSGGSGCTLHKMMLMSSMYRFVYMGIVILFFTGCSRDDIIIPQQQYGSIQININYSIDDEPLVWDTILYKNAAGNEYGISRLNYYLSDIHFFSNRKLMCQVDSIFYVDAAGGTSSSFLIPSIAPGTYDSITFCIGIRPEKNVSYGLSNTTDNINMGWPDAMGGGYHFLKLEGHWNDKGSATGFAMHLGKNGFQCVSGFPCKINVHKETCTPLMLQMNINEWFKNPNIYNFDTDGVYSMGNATLMKKLAENGVDVFKAY